MKVLRILVTVVTLALCGCTVAGSPMPGPAPDTLDVGPFSRYPLIAPTTVSEAQGQILESIRMAEAMADPKAVDPALTVPLGGKRAVPLPTPAKAAGLLADPVSAVLRQHGMLAGFTVGATDTPAAVHASVGTGRLLQILVLRFPDSAAAQQAAQEIDAVDFAVSPDNVAVAIPGHAAARGHWRPTVPTMAATTAQDSFVISVLVGERSPDQAALSSLAGKAFDAQIPLLREFAPTPAGRFTELPLDRDGMLGRMVPEAPGRWPYPQVILGELDPNAGWSNLLQARGIVYGPRGAELFQGRAVQPYELLALNRFDRLVRYADAAAARKQFALLRDSATDGGHRLVPGPTGLVDVNCKENTTDSGASMTRFSCVLVFGRYLALVLSRDYEDVRQRAAAQYALLVNSE
ncbi:DUF7373 family lipoprotein [Nocardia sp. CDC160]|uniref:DUF7373 family lipoprotein n=1 Tax=Nocardia sp. CDC160 TaxID=3112166 RepID=UPI002DB8EE14|nr:hypothetical protein [Nocardia sp. CDC160]MEC3917820.1 hypothetical protein [Nocardia sp. CDC160]